MADVQDDDAPGAAAAANNNRVMPARGQSTAPKFNPSQPRELRRYFAELDTLFLTCNIDDHAEKKMYACRYLDIDSAELWETLPEYADAHTYGEFVTAVYLLYPGSEEDRKWSITDMDKLIGEQLRLGILNATDLGVYYRSFYAITQFLISQNRLSTAEQSRAFVRGFQSDLRQRVAQRLELKFPDHLPDDHYDLTVIHAAAKFVLHGTTPTMFQSRITPSTPSISQPTTLASPSVVKTEDFTTFLDKFAQTLIKALASPSNPSVRSHESTPNYAQSDNAGRCNFCGEAGHFLNACLILARYITEGKCKRNAEGKIILPTGAYCPRTIPGTCFMERIDEWHRRNPGHITAVQISNSTTGQMMYGISVAPAPAPASALASTQMLQQPYSSSYQLTAAERIESLEKEILALRSKRAFDGVEIVRPRRAPPKIAEEVPSSHVNPIPSAAVPAPPSQPPVKPTQPAPTPDPVPSTVPPPALAPTPAPVPATVPATQKPAEPPIHPFAKVPETSYRPPHERNFAAPPPKPKDKDSAYRTQAPVQDKKIADDVYARSMTTPFVTLSPQELLSLSPEVRQKVRDSVTPKRITGDSKDVLYTAHNTNTDTIDDDLPYASNTAFSDPPPGSIVIADPYEAFFTNLRPGERPAPITVAKESLALRSIHMLIDNQETIECIVDPGSQIIAMSEDYAHQLGLIYDPTIVLNMESANGEIDQSLGLARNVSCNIGDVTLYLQIHVIREPAYDVLLGRPFDVLTESIVKNFANEDQTITIRDPNTGRRITIPTVPRGPPRRRNRTSTHGPDFRS
jgi:hypothetical protein